jgi:hypothetical protein
VCIFTYQIYVGLWNKLHVAQKNSY